MGKIFDTEGGVMSFLGKMADLLWLNILTLLCCIPIVTIGASTTAMYTMTLKMVNKEEGYITKGFFTAFKKNFKQATIIWMITLVVFILFYVDYRIILYSGIKFPKVLMILLTAMLILMYATYMYIFPVLARYENSTKNVLKNSFILSISNLPKTVLIIIMQFIPIVVLYYIPMSVPVILLFGLTAVAYVSSLLFMTIFKKIEEKWAEEAESQDIEEHQVDEHQIDS
ncbi:MAG: DUF624 domain-containing protein [Lachnospiraceae bacterium]